MRKTVTLIAIGLTLGLLTAAADMVRRAFATPLEAQIRVVHLTPAAPTPLATTPSPTATASETATPTAVGTATLPPSPTSPPTPLATITSAPTIYTVQAGDTFFTIATRYGISMEQLAAANQRTLNDLLYIGDELLIPRPDFEPVSGSTAVTTNTLPFEFDQPADAPTAINNIPYADILLLSETAADHVREIFVRGQTLGRSPRAFAKVGDSTVENDHFLSRFDRPELGYNLGEYAYLQRVIDYYAGSFNRDSAAVRIGLHAWTMFDPQWADYTRCASNESPIACEIRLHNPAIVLIRIGANDVGVPEYYEQSLRRIVEYCLVQGVIPVIGTKADRNDGWDSPNNAIMRNLAAEYDLPLWEYDRVAETLPGRGLDEDGIHMNTYYAHDYTDPIAFQKGHAVHNLTALVVLDLLTQLVNQ